MKIALSYGGGVQSVAICVLIKEGALPVPDVAGIADTGREVGSTWEYFYGVIQPYLDSVLKIEVVPHTLARVDVYAPDGLTLMPAYTRSLEPTALFEGDTYIDGRLPAYCSGEWKRDVMERWYRLKGLEECIQWIGYSTDEAGRVKGDHRYWCHNRFPLLEKGISREMCKRIIEGAGLPLPKKSRCWCCPHQTVEEWLEVKERPEEWAAAVNLEKEINSHDPRQSGLYLYSGRVPLPLADFKSDAGLLPARDCVGHCWT